MRAALAPTLLAIAEQVEDDADWRRVFYDLLRQVNHESTVEWVSRQLRERSRIDPT